MPARKNRPDKYKGPQGVQLLNFKISADEKTLADKLIKQENGAPFKDHYVGWPDMKIAEKMAKKGFLRASSYATGCFFLTDLFKRQFQSQ